MGKSWFVLMGSKKRAEEKIVEKLTADQYLVGSKRIPKTAAGARALARINYLESQNQVEECKREVCTVRNCKRKALTEGIRIHLTLARKTLDKIDGRWSRRRLTQGVSLEHIWTHLRAVDVAMLELVSEEDLVSRSYEVLDLAEAHLTQDHPQRVELTELVKNIRSGQPSPVDRGILIHTMEAAHGALDAEIGRVRNLRNMLMIATVAVLIGVTAIAFYGYYSPRTFNLCFIPRVEVDKIDSGKAVCPTSEKNLVAVQDSLPGHSEKHLVAAQDSLPGHYVSKWDVFAVEVAGLCGAAVTVITSLRRMPGTSKPYGLPLAAAVLKFPTGALTAFLGLLFIKGAFIPGLSNLDSQAQILAWAAVFGAAQHLVTRLVDTRAQETLSAVSLAPGSTGTSNGKG